MNELVVIVEGETEQTFVRDQLAAHLAIHGSIAWAVLPGRHRKHGGVKKWEVARQDIVRTLKENRFCTTMFDFYAMPKDWPGREDASQLEWKFRADHVEQMLQKDIAGTMSTSFNQKFFVPYVQLHEFESLTFSDTNELAAVLSPIGSYSTTQLGEKFQNIVEQAGEPEAINDGYETCPSRRISKIVPAYKKRAQGPIVTRRIGLEMLRQKCPHFGKWLSKLEQLVG